MTFTSDYSAEQRLKVNQAIQQVQQQIRWKSGKDVEHLQTRKRHGHLAKSATLADYHAIIFFVVSSKQAQLYMYRWREDLYLTIVAPYQGKIWLVMLSMDGILVTAFPPTDPEIYLADQRFSHYGLLTEL